MLCLPCTYCKQPEFLFRGGLTRASVYLTREVMMRIRAWGEQPNVWTHLNSSQIIIVLLEILQFYSSSGCYIQCIQCLVQLSKSIWSYDTLVIIIIRVSFTTVDDEKFIMLMLIFLPIFKTNFLIDMLLIWPFCSSIFQELCYNFRMWHSPLWVAENDAYEWI